MRNPAEVAAASCAEIGEAIGITAGCDTVTVIQSIAKYVSKEQPSEKTETTEPDNRPVVAVLSSDDTNTKFDYVADKFKTACTKAGVVPGEVRLIGDDRSWAESLTHTIIDWRFDESMPSIDIRRFDVHEDVRRLEREGLMRADTMSTGDWSVAYNSRDWRLLDGVDRVLVLESDWAVRHKISKCKDIEAERQCWEDYIVTVKYTTEENHADEGTQEDGPDRQTRTANTTGIVEELDDDVDCYDIETERRTGEHSSQPKPFTDGNGKGTTGETEFTSGQ